MRRYWMCFGLLFCVVSSCQRQEPQADHTRGAAVREQYVASDTDNGLGLTLEVPGSGFRRGRECAFTMIVRNLTEDRYIVLPEFLLEPDFLDKKSSRIPDRSVFPPPSWRYFFVSNPFLPRNRPHSDGIDLFLDTINPGSPSKKLQRIELRDWCEEITLHYPDWLKTLSLGPGDSWKRTYTARIPSDADYVDVGLFFELDKLGVTKPLMVPVTQGEGRKDGQKLPIWEGFLYVFLKIPD